MSDTQTTARNKLAEQIRLMPADLLEIAENRTKLENISWRRAAARPPEDRNALRALSYSKRQKLWTQGYRHALSESETLALSAKWKKQYWTGEPTLHESKHRDSKFTQSVEYCNCLNACGGNGGRHRYETPNRLSDHDAGSCVKGGYFADDGPVVPYDSPAAQPAIFVFEDEDARLEGSFRYSQREVLPDVTPHAEVGYQNNLRVRTTVSVDGTSAAVLRLNELLAAERLTDSLAEPDPRRKKILQDIAGGPTSTAPGQPRNKIETPNRCPHEVLHREHCSLCMQMARNEDVLMRFADREAPAPSELPYWILFDCIRKSTVEERTHWVSELVKANDEDWIAFKTTRLAELDSWMTEAKSYLAAGDEDFKHWKSCLEHWWDRGALPRKPQVAGELDGHRFVLSRDSKSGSDEWLNYAEEVWNNNERTVGRIQWDFGAGEGAHTSRRVYDVEGCRETTMEPGLYLAPSQRKNVAQYLASEKAAGRLKGLEFGRAALSFEILTGNINVERFAKTRGAKANTLIQRALRLKLAALNPPTFSETDVAEFLTEKQWADITTHGGVRVFCVSRKGRVEMFGDFRNPITKRRAFRSVPLEVTKGKPFSDWPLSAQATVLVVMAAARSQETAKAIRQAVKGRFGADREEAIAEARERVNQKFLTTFFVNYGTPEDCQRGWGEEETASVQA